MCAIVWAEGRHKLPSWEGCASPGFHCSSEHTPGPGRGLPGNDAKLLHLSCSGVSCQGHFLQCMVSLELTACAQQSHIVYGEDALISLPAVR